MLRHRLIATSVVAVSVGLAGCAGSSTSLFKPPAPPTQALQFESQPEGADVRTADGQTCQTPCSLALPLTAQSVSFAMNGYLPQTLPVEVHASETLFSGAFAPNPVTAMLQTIPKPAAKPKPRKSVAKATERAKTANTLAPPSAAPMSGPAPAPAQDNAFPPPPPMSSPVASRFPTLPPQPPATQ